jgi:hypothetical protein
VERNGSTRENLRGYNLTSSLDFNASSRGRFEPLWFSSSRAQGRAKKQGKVSLVVASSRRLVASSSRRRFVSSLRLVVSFSSRLVASSRRFVSSLRLVVSFSFRLVVSFSSRRLAFVSSFRFVSSSRRLAFVSSSRRLAFVSSSRFRFAGRGEGGGKKRGRWDELNQRGSKRPLEDALKSNFGRLLSTPPLKFSLVLPFLSTLLLGFFGSSPSLWGFFSRLAG